MKRLSLVQVFFIFAAIGSLLSASAWAIMVHVFGFETAMIVHMILR